MARKYHIETFGCQMNVHDSERMAGLLDQAGYEPTDDEHDADVIVINTCSVREHAEDKLYTRLGELRVLGEETGRRPIVAVAGCVAQQEGAVLLRTTNGQVIDVVVGTQRLKMLPILVDQATEARRHGDHMGCLRDPASGDPARNWPVVDVAPWDDVSFPLGIARRGDPVKAYVTIIEGCNDYCAFCVVPYTRGHERMRPKADILAEVRHAAESGRREIQLLGQIVNHYQAPDDPACDFAQLLTEVHEVPGVERIRFASPHPRHTSTRLIAAVRDLPKVCKHMHLPVQSGSTRVLRAMRRRHTREQYLDLVGRIREAIPNVALSTDMIVGFPGEDVGDFEQTLSLVEAVQYHGIFSFKYSQRPNTLASKRMPDDVPEAEKTARIVALQALQRGIQTRLHEQAIGTTAEVLVDAVSRRRNGEMSGRTTGNAVVNFPPPGANGARTPDPGTRWIGRTVPVTIRRAGPNSLWGHVVDVPASAVRDGGSPKLER
jgi:tRNA-2-methylthio-N6-dimethylallyladenosine synthase